MIKKRFLKGGLHLSILPSLPLPHSHPWDHSGHMPEGPEVQREWGQQRRWDWLKKSRGAEEGRRGLLMVYCSAVTSAGHVRKYTSFLLSPSSLCFNFFKPQGGLSLTQRVSRVYPLGYSLRSEIMLWLARLESHDYPWKEGSGPGLTGEKQVYRRLSCGEGVWMLLKERTKRMLDGCSAHFLVRRSITLKEDWTTKRYLDRTS